MEYPKFNVSGRVINSLTKEGVYNLRVEAWDKDVKYNDLLGVEQTNTDGSFEISFDLSYFREYAPDNAPDLFFKIYNGRELIKSTEDSVTWNASEQTDIVIDVDIIEERPVGIDYISSQQVFNFAKFLSDSDFKGYQKQTTEKVRQNFSFAKGILKNAFIKMNVNPIRVSGPKIDEIIGQDVDVARRNLAAKQIDVNEERDYNPGFNRESIKEISSLPVNLKAGEKVNLYKENGKVKYYSVVSEEKQANIELSGKIELQRMEIESLQKELKLTREREDVKNTQITQLRESTELLKNEQFEIWQRIGKGDNGKPSITKQVTPSKRSGRKGNIK